METRCKDNCPCCGSCKDCSSFQKIIDLKNVGLVIYRYANRKDEVNKRTGLKKRSTNTRDDIYIIRNTKDIQIKARESISDTDQGIICARCRELIQRAKKYMRDIPSLDKKGIISICDHCKQNKIKQRYCYKCHEVLKKYHAEEVKQNTAKEQTNIWLHNLNKLKNVITVKSPKQTLKWRSVSETYLNDLCKATVREGHQMQIRPMLEKGVGMSDSVHSIDNDTKSETVFKFLDPEYIKSKTVFIRDDSFIPIETLTPSLVTTYDIPSFGVLSNEREKLKSTSLQSLKGLSHRDSEFAAKIKTKHGKPSTLKKYYSEEDIFHSAKSLTDHDKNKDLKYFFPNEKIDEVPLRKGKTSAELVLDIKEMLHRQTRDVENNTKRKEIAEKEVRSKDKHTTFSEDRTKKHIKKKEYEKSARIKESIADINDSKSSKGKELPSEKEKKLRTKVNEDTFDSKLTTSSKSGKEKIKSDLKSKTETDSPIKDNKDKFDGKSGKGKVEKELNLKKATDLPIKDNEDKLDSKSGKGIVDKAIKSRKETDSRAIDNEDKLDSKRVKRKVEEELKSKKETDSLAKDNEGTLDIKSGKVKVEEELKSKKETDSRAKDNEDKLDIKSGKVKVEEDLKSKKETDSRAKDNEDKLDSKSGKEKVEKELKSKKETDPRANNNEDKLQPAEEKKDRVKKEKHKEKQEQLQEVTEEKRRSKEEQQKLNDEKTPHNNQPQAVSKPDPILLILKKQLDEEYISRKMERDRKIKEEAERKLKLLEETKVKKIIHKSKVIKKQDNATSTEPLYHQDLNSESDIENKIKSTPAMFEIIVGNQISKSKRPLPETIQTEEVVPIVYNSSYKEDTKLAQNNDRTEKTINLKNNKALSQKYGEQDPFKGIVRYALSDRSFIDKGWTMLPTEKVVRKMNVYRMRPAHPEFDWFDRNKNMKQMHYDTGEKLAEFDDKGRGRWFYRNGRIALDYYDAEEINAQQRFVIYGSGEPDERGRYQPCAILATFDYLGNGVVFDHTGKIRLKYNQTEGVVLDRTIGPVSQWKWHTLNDPPVLQKVMIDTQMAHKDPDILKLGGPNENKTRPDNEEMLAIEFDNFIKEKSKKLTQTFKPFQIRTKALKINENFSLKVLDQANIYLIFRDGTTNIKLNIGMILDHKEIVDTDTAEVGEVSNNLERFPARTDSLAGLQRSVAHAQRVERLRVERERRLRYPKPCSSVDKLLSAASRPLKPKLHTVPSKSTVTTNACNCNCRKQTLRNVYYDTRFV